MATPHFLDKKNVISSDLFNTLQYMYQRYKAEFTEASVRVTEVEITVEPRCNDLRYWNDSLDITINIFQPGRCYSKMY